MPKKHAGVTKKKKRRPWEDITPLQYQQGWELVNTNHTTQQILSATGLTKPQLSWLMREGSEAQGMPGYHARVAEQAALIRHRAQKAADKVGKGAVESIDRSVEIAKMAQEVVKQTMASYMILSVKPMLKKIQDGAATPEDLKDFEMPRGMRETLKSLKPYTDFSTIAQSFRTVFDSPHQQRDVLSHLPKEVRVDMSGEAMMPATVAIIEEIDKGDAGHDPLDALIPEAKNWTLEEIDLYSETGERPAVDYDGEEDEH